MPIYLVPRDLMRRHWAGEETAVARLPVAGTTHLIAAEALAVVDVVAEHPAGLPLREIAHKLGLVSDADEAVTGALQRMIDGLVHSGLLRQLDDDAAPGRDACA